MKTTTQTFKIQDPRSGEIQNVNAGELMRLFDQEGVIVFPAFYDKELDAVNREMEQFFAPYQAEADAKSGVSEGASKHGCDVIPWNPLETNNDVLSLCRGVIALDVSHLVAIRTPCQTRLYWNPGRVRWFSCTGMFFTALHPTLI